MASWRSFRIEGPLNNYWRVEISREIRTVGAVWTRPLLRRFLAKDKNGDNDDDDDDDDDNDDDADDDDNSDDDDDNDDDDLRIKNVTEDHA